MPPSAIATGGRQWTVGSSLRSSFGGKTVTTRKHRKILRDTIMGVTKPAIRRLARRGGVKRMSEFIYSDIRDVIKLRLTTILHRCVIHLEYLGKQTVTAELITTVLKEMGITLYGFDYPNLDADKRRKQPLRT